LLALEPAVLVIDLPSYKMLETDRKLLAEKAVQLISHFKADVEQTPVLKLGEFDELYRQLWRQPPDAPCNADILFEQLRVILEHTAQFTHPKCFAFIPGVGNDVSAVADYIASSLNVGAGSWLTASGPILIEQLVLDWFCKLCNLGTQAGGILLSGGSMANLVALVTARNSKLAEGWHKGTVYFSDQTHFSVKRALTIAGFAKTQWRPIPSNEKYMIDLAALACEVETDLAAGLHPFCIVANGGTTNTGSVDNLADIGNLCRQFKLWFHVDAAYGFPTLLLDSHRKQFEGIELADSITFDPHKWLFQNHACGALLMKSRKDLCDAFSDDPEYVRDATTAGSEINYWDYGPEMTRPFRALKVWMSINYFGMDAFRAAISQGITNAEYAEQLLRTNQDWEITSKAQNAVITFRYKPKTAPDLIINEINDRIGKRMIAQSEFFVISTKLKNQTVIRLCTINPRTTRSMIESCISSLTEIASKETQEIQYTVS
jgi:glutamate/tyrosine decarboxylase-like PLP-dependent enzyme